MKLIMLGAPGSGKGTQAKKIVEYLKVPHISTGDIFRRHMRENTPLGIKVKDIISEGRLVPDDITIQIVHERLIEPDCKKGFVLDGFPRSLPQAVALDSLHKIDYVINLDVENEIVIARTTGRRTCKTCGTMFNTHEIGGEIVCAKCGGELYIRTDDTLEAVMERLEMYEEKTRPLVQYYAKQGKLVNINADNEPDKVYKAIIEAIKK